MAASWRTEALRIIDERYHSIQAAQPDLEPAVILRMVSLHYYPFGQRRYHPYKMWLKALKEYRTHVDRAVGELPGFRDFAPLLDI